MKKLAILFVLLLNPEGHLNAFANDSEYDDLELTPDWTQSSSCIKATPSQIAAVNLGNKKLSTFLSECDKATNNSAWCAQLIRPNPASYPIFACTYGTTQPHYLVNPDESTWDFAFTAIHLIDQLEKVGLRPCQIYNWWRPEPYNKNVGGAPGRHPFGTSVDVRFCNDNDAVKAFDKLCVFRKQGELRAIGYYGSSGVHFGVGDKTANTWGRSCE